MMPTMAPAGTLKDRLSISTLVAERLGDVLELDHLVAQTVGHGDEDFLGLVALLVFVRRSVPRSAAIRALLLAWRAFGVLAHPLRVPSCSGLGARFCALLLGLQARSFWSSQAL